MKSDVSRGLVFKSNSICELNEEQMANLKGGSTIHGGPDCSGCMCFTVIETVFTTKKNF